MKSPRILVIEDEDLLRDAIANSLLDEGYQVTQAANGEQGRSLFQEKGADLMLLDLMLPDLDGFDLLREFRTGPQRRHLPIIIITARDAIPHRVKGLDLGADDYMVKPLSLIELKARIRTQLRGDHPGLNTLEYSQLKLDRDRERIYQKDEKGDWSQTPVTQLEFHILWFLASNHPDPMSRESICEEVYHETGFMIANTLDVHIYNIRRKVGTDWIQTVHRKGFRFQVPHS